MKTTKRDLKRALLTWGFITSVAAFTSCSHRGPAIQEYAETADPGAEVTALDSEMASAVTNQVDVLAPANFAEASNALMDAKKSLDKGKSGKTTLHYVAVGHAYLKNANEFADVSRSNIEDVIDARQRAMKAGALQYHLGEFQASDKSLKRLTANIENNNLGNVESERPGLQAMYVDLEVKSLQEANLGEAKKTIEIAKDERAKKYAPRSLAKAEKTMKDTEAFIAGNPHQSDEIASRTSEARSAADHLLKITRESTATKKKSTEELALDLEGEQTKTAMTQEQLSEEQRASRALADEKSRMEMEQAFNARFENARQMFTVEEADVYKQGNILLLRLKGLQFPSNKATLAGRNFPLLKKVQDVITSFDAPTVTIEGHTDSIGSKEANQKISVARAEAVRDYLISSGLENVEIKAIGYGFDKPIASNKTEAGRRQNRRVDVVVQAERSDNRVSGIQK